MIYKYVYPPTMNYETTLNMFILRLKDAINLKLVCIVENLCKIIPLYFGLWSQTLDFFDLWKLYELSQSMLYFLFVSHALIYLALFLLVLCLWYPLLGSIFPHQVFWYLASKVFYHPHSHKLFFNMDQLHALHTLLANILTLIFLLLSLHLVHITFFSLPPFSLLIF